MQRHFPVSLVAVSAIVMLLGACATPSVQIIQTLVYPAGDDLRLSNILVISVAGDYAERAQLERSLSAALTTDHTTAAPYYAVVGRSPHVTRNTITTVIKSRKFDGVLFVRMQGQDIPDAAPGRPTGQGFQLFLYDYEEFNRPSQLPLDATVTFVSEIYAADREKKVWGIESLSFDLDTAGEVIELQTKSIVAKIRKDRLTAN